MVGFLRKKKSDKTMLSFDTALDRKGKVDGASLLDDNGDPTSGSLYDMRNPGARRNSNQENAAWDTNTAANSHTYPPPYPHQQQQAPMPYGGAFQQQQQLPAQQQYPVPPAMHTGFGNVNAGYPRQYGAHQQQPQQYPVRYGAHQQQQSYGAPQNTFGAPPQGQYPVQYGNYPPPPMQPEAPKKSGFFRIPGRGKKN